MIQYLLACYFFTFALFDNNECRNMFIKSQNKLTTVEYGLFQKCLFEHFDKEVFELVNKITSIHKLTYKDLDKNVFDDSFYNYLLNTNILAVT